MVELEGTLIHVTVFDASTKDITWDIDFFDKTMKGQITVLHRKGKFGFIPCVSGTDFTPPYVRYTCVRLFGKDRR